MGPGAPVMPPHMMMQMMAAQMAQNAAKGPGDFKGDDNPPNETLYINNLNDRVNPKKIKPELEKLFKKYGEIRDIVAMKSFWRRGQAWIIYRKVEQAMEAMKNLQGTLLRGRPLRISFAKTKSDVTAKDEGTFMPRVNRLKRPPGMKKALAEQLLAMATGQQQVKMEQAQQAKDMQQAVVASNGVSVKHEDGSFGQAGMGSRPEGTKSKRKWDQATPSSPMMGAPPSQVPKTAQNQAAVSRAIGAFTMPWASASKPVAELPPALPHRTLFIEMLPDEITDSMLIAAFRQFPGFLEARLIAGRRVAFVDYENEGQATIALSRLQGFPILDGYPMKISYARR